MLKLKETLLAHNFVDNSYLDDYVELVLNNYTTALKTGRTQKHHVVPVSCYNKFSAEYDSHRKEALRLAEADPDNYKVNLTFADHLKAHYLLSRCSGDITQILCNANACMLMIRTLLPALTAGVVVDLKTPENQQTAYEYIRTTLPASSSSFKERAGVFNTPPKRKHKANCKVRCVETGEVFNSIKEAEAAKELSKGRLNTILAGYRKQIPGMTFKYYDEN